MDLQGQNGLMDTYRKPWRNRGLGGVLVSVGLILFYLVLYFEDKLEPLIHIRPLTQLAESVGLRNRWYLYGFTYCVLMILGGAFYLRKHGNSRYNQLRIAVNVTVQVLLGFLLPFVMPLFNGPELYFSYFWPLKYDYLYPHTLQDLPLYFAAYTVLGSLVLAPVMAYFYGKRWYCSWVCGCGGLANTFGDPWRHLTSKSTRAWRFEKQAIYLVLGVALLTTAMVGMDFLVGSRHPTFHRLVAGEHWDDWSLKYLYGLVVGSILAGVVGTGLYPLLGPRVWCRNFCPMAAFLGLAQKFGRFHIRVKPGMCISCGNCSTYCEMGIDVRSYAQSDQSFTRAACVGCGMCAHVCPRGVLKLENVSKGQADKQRQGLRVLDL